MKEQDMTEAEAALLELIEKRGAVTAKEVVTAARPKTSPMHERFEWDDSVAGERFREHQARWWMGSLRVVVEIDDKPVPMRRLVAVPDASQENAGPDRYMPIEKAAADPEKWELVMRNARLEARSFVVKLERLESIKPGSTGDLHLHVRQFIGTD